MPTRTELMNERFTTEEGKEIASSYRMLSYLSDIYGEAYTVLNLFRALGLAFDQLGEYVQFPQNPANPLDLSNSLVRQIFPQLATWNIESWERQYGLAIDTTLELKTRQNRVASRVRDRAPMHPKKLAQLVSVAALGKSARIVENTGPYKFSIYISCSPGGYNDADVRKTIDRAKPAHLVYDIFNEQSAAAKLYCGGIARCGKKITIRQGVL